MVIHILSVMDKVDMNLHILNHTNVCHESNNYYILIQVCCKKLVSKMKEGICLILKLSALQES
jgi:hypothetical protein